MKRPPRGNPCCVGSQSRQRPRFKDRTRINHVECSSLSAVCLIKSLIKGRICGQEPAGYPSDKQEWFALKSPLTHSETDNQSSRSHVQSMGMNRQGYMW